MKTEQHNSPETEHDWRRRFDEWHTKAADEHFRRHMAARMRAELATSTDPVTRQGCALGLLLLDH